MPTIDLFKNKPVDLFADEPVDLFVNEPEKFNPEGQGYDYQSAEKAGLKPDETGHWQSRLPLNKEESEKLGLPEDSGLILKGMIHETIDKTKEAEKSSGYKIIKKGERYYSIPNPEMPTIATGYNPFKDFKLPMVVRKYDEKEPPIKIEDYRKEKEFEEGFFDTFAYQFNRSWLATGYQTASSFHGAMAHFTNNVDKIGQFLVKKHREQRELMAKAEEKTGIPYSKIPDMGEVGAVTFDWLHQNIFKPAADIFEYNREYWQKRAKEKGIGFLEELFGEALGGAVPGITEFAMNVPYAAFLGAADAEREGRNEFLGMLVKGAERGILGKIFHSMNHLNLFYKAPLMGGVFGAQSFSYGADPREAAKGFGTGFLYALMGGKGEVEAQRIIDMMKRPDKYKVVEEKADIEVAEKYKNIADYYAERNRPEKLELELKRAEETAQPAKELGVSKDLEPLVQEARKHKTAEEFVEKNYFQVLSDKFNQRKMKSTYVVAQNQKTKVGTVGDFIVDKALREEFKEVLNVPVFTNNKLSQNNPARLVSHKGDIKLREAQKKAGTPSSYIEIGSAIESGEGFESNLMHEIIHAKRNYLGRKMGGVSEESAISGAKYLKEKAKSQLTDIWNKANKPELEPLAPKTPALDKFTLADTLKEERKRFEQLVEKEFDEGFKKELRDNIINLGGIDVRKNPELREELKDIPQALRREGGQAVDDIATQLGYKDGYELVDDIRSIYMQGQYGEGARLARKGEIERVEPEFKKGEKLSDEYIYHHTSKEALKQIEKEGFTQGAFSNRPVKFFGDTWIAVKKSDLPGIEEHIIDKTRTDYETNFVTGYDREGFPVEKPLPPEKIYLVDKNGKVIKRLGTKSTTAKFAPEEGFRRQPPEKEGEATEPQKRSDIVKLLSEKLDIPIRTGRFREKALGIFKLESEVIRTQKANDIEVISHEVGHALHKFLWPETISSRGAEKPQKSEHEFEVMKMASKPKKGQPEWAEGFAEFIRKYITQPEKAKAEAPKYYDFFEKEVEAKSPETLEILLESRRQFQKWLKQPALMRVLGQVSIGEKESRPGKFSDLYTKFIDELHPLEKMVKEMTKGRKLPVGKDPYKLARLMAGWTGKADAYLLHKPFKFETYKNIEGSKGLREILAPLKGNLDEFRAYIISKRALELEARKIDTGIFKADAEKIITQYDVQFGKAFEDLKAYQDHVLTYLKDSGVLDAETFAKIKEMNKDYVPFYRIFEGKKGAGVGYGLQSRQPIKKIKGSWRDIQDPLESIVKNTYLYINLAERNAVGRALVDLAKTNEGLGKFVEKIPTPIKGIKVQANEILDKIAIPKEIRDALPEGIKDEQISIFRPNAMFPADNVISVWKDGKREFYEVDPEIARTFKALDRENANMVIQLLSIPAKWLRAGAVTLSPEFWARNPIRDQFPALMYSEYGYVPFVDLFRGVFHLAKRDNIYWDWKKSGGTHSMLTSMDRNYLQKNLKDIMRVLPLKSPVKNPLEFLAVLGENVAIVGETMEAGTRLGEFGKGIKKRGTSKEAIQEVGFSSREITLDFQKRGATGKWINMMTAFWNAQIQDPVRLTRALKNNPRTLPMAIAFITIPSIVIEYINYGNPIYEDQPDWLKDLFWLVPTGSKDAPNKEFPFIPIPKPFVPGVIFGTIPQRITRYILDRDPAAFDDTMGTLGRAFNPGLIPTAAIPVIENWANKSFFFDRPIVPPGMEDLLPEYQFRPRTTETAKFIGQFVSRVPNQTLKDNLASPAKVENLIRGWSGGAGMYALKAVDAILEKTGVTEKKIRPTRTLKDIPVIKAFVIRYPSGSSEAINDFYESYKKAMTIEKTAKFLIDPKIGKFEEGLKLQLENDILKLQKTYTALGNMRKMINFIYDTKTMTSDEKREFIDNLYIQMIEAAKLGNELIKEYQETMKEIKQ